MRDRVIRVQQIEKNPHLREFHLLITRQTRIFSGKSINYSYDLDNEKWFDRGACIGKFKEESGQIIVAVIFLALPVPRRAPEIFPNGH